MKREIKFRGKRIDNGEWIYGSLLDGDIIAAGPIDADEDYIGLGEWSSVDPETVGQYTGLKDRNGKEIYEGDIWKSEYGRKFLVELDVDQHAGYYPFVTDDGCGCCSDETRKNPTQGEVIGNRWDNPDLLEG